MAYPIPRIACTTVFSIVQDNVNYKGKGEGGKDKKNDHTVFFRSSSLKRYLKITMNESEKNYMEYEFYK